jgi:hypothetical protein
MKFKFHWGWGIGIVYTAFALSMILVLFLSFGVKNDLVDKDYYQKEINYQQQINKIQRTQALPEQIKFEFKNENFVIKFPEFFKSKPISGQVYFYRPSDEKKDMKLNISTNENLEMIIPLNKIYQGLWRLKIEFKADNLEYYYEEAIKM